MDIKILCETVVHVDNEIYIYIYIHSDDIWTGMYATNLLCVHMDNKTFIYI